MKKQGGEDGVVMEIVRGERAILKELEMERKRDERNKLLRFHV